MEAQYVGFMAFVVLSIAGFFTRTNIENLNASSIKVVWEHDLSGLEPHA